MHAPSRSTAALAVAGLLASTGTAVVGARNLLTIQADRARSVIPKSRDVPPRADGVYLPEGGPPLRWTRGTQVDLHLMIFGDSTATGYGCRSADEVPGVRIARGLAQESGKRIRLSTKSIVGATSKGLAGQVDAMFVAGSPPDAAVIMIGANDVTAVNGIGPSARRLGAAVHRLRSSGAVVVVGTCPDFGSISAIPQPLRWAARSRGLRLARAQAAAVRAAGGLAVPMADLLAPNFLEDPEEMFSDDGYHPSAAGYELAANQLLPALCHALGDWTGRTVPDLPWTTPQDGGSRVARLAPVTRLLRRPTTGVPAPLVMPSG